jgi:hypothetical protein
VSGTDRRRSRITLLAAAAAGAALVSAAAARAATPPVDWKNLVVNVRPLVRDQHPTNEDRVTVLVAGDSTPDCAGLTFSPAVVTGTTIRLDGHRYSPPFECIPFSWSQEIELPPLGAFNNYRIEVYDEDLLIHAQPLEVWPPRHELFLFDKPGQFVYGDYVLRVKVDLTDPVAGPARPASSVFQTNSAGYFWFFDPNNVEVTAKVVDGRPVNGHYWIFLTGMSNLGFTVTVTRVSGCGPSPCPQRTYVNPPGQRLNVIDTQLP